MNLKNKIKKTFTAEQIKKTYGLLEMIPDEVMVKFLYYANTSRRLNFKNPERFTEKIQWYKLNYKDDLMTLCADKYGIREYVEKKGYTDMLVELYQVVESYDEINFNEFPNSFVIKSNNGSGTNLFVENKIKSDFQKIEKTIESWKKIGAITIGREWAYKNIVPRITIEEYLKPDDRFQKENGLNDYKIFCFNGKAKLLHVDINRNKNHKRTFFDLNWNKFDIISDRPRYDGIISKPENFNKMIEIAEDFAEDFPFVRVDFYNLNGKIYIGELTFYPWSGCVQFTPDEFDYYLGKLFKLPILNIDGRNKV